MRERVTSLGGVPAVAQEILDFPGIEKFDLQLRSFPMGGAPVPPRLPRRVREVFGDAIQMFNGYGGTETTSAVVTNVGAEYAARPDSVGRPNLTAELRVLGPDGASLPRGQVGELAFRSPQVVKGYWNNPVATKESFVDGWFRTGDLGYVDDEGYVYVVDRLEGRGHPRRGERLLRRGRGGSRRASRGSRTSPSSACRTTPWASGSAPWWCRASEPSCGWLTCVSSPPPGWRRFKCPEALWVTQELPRTATDKVSKGELRAHVPDADLERTY